MSNKFTLRSNATLFTFAVLGLALASVVYVSLPSALPLSVCIKPYARFNSIMLSLTLTFLCGFFELRLCALSILAFIRFFAATLVCYLQFNQITFHYLVLLLFCGLEGFLFLSFCRLSCLFGQARRINPTNKCKYTRQFISDYLFYCGICTVLLVIYLILIS